MALGTAVYVLPSVSITEMVVEPGAAYLTFSTTRSPAVIVKGLLVIDVPLPS